VPAIIHSENALERKSAIVHGIRLTLTRLGVLSAHPAAFLVLVVYAALWIWFDWQNFGWAGVATIATLFKTLLIQRAEHRDTQAIHGKLDELLRSSGAARVELTRLDDQEPELIERHREHARAGDPT
jgi:low affinity Fe/Cu permease